MVTTSENLKVNNVKAKNVQGQQIDLLPLPNNIWSIQSLVPGIYLLDVIVDMSSSGILGVYETVLVILQPEQTPLPPSNVINQLSIFIETEFPPGPNTTTPKPGPVPPNQTEPIICTMEISYGQGPCDEYYIPPDENGQCPEDHRFVDDRTGCVPNDFVSPPCSIDAQGNEVCPPTDDLTPVPELPPPDCPPEVQENGVCPPTDDLTPVPEPPTPDCPEAGPELCGEEPPPEEVPPDSDDGTNDNGNDNGNGEDGSNGGGDDNENGEDIPSVPLG
jgi:hypothetical protein